MLWLVILVVVLLMWVAARAVQRSSEQGANETRHPGGSAIPQGSVTSRSPVSTRPRPSEPARPRSAGRSQHGGLFAYAGPAGRGTREHVGPYAVIDVETTGFSPQGGDRVIEVAVARVDATGRVEDEFATLVNPEGRDTGPVFVHGISNDAVAKAPTFAEVAPELLARLDGAVVVAHNAPFEERFLSAELARTGHTEVRLPALCSLWLGQQIFTTPNHKLATLARHAGIPLVDAHAALGDVRAVAALLPRMLDAYGEPLHYGCGPFVPEGMVAGQLRPVTRAVALRKGTDGWMHSLMARLPMSAGDVDDATAEAYLDALAEVLADGKIVGDEAKTLAKLAGAAGMGGAQVASLNERFLETMRDAAFDDDVLTTAELRQLTAAAKALGVPTYFDDLTPVAPSTGLPRVSAEPVVSTRTRRCGHCRTPGHYRSTCPELTA